MCVPSGSVRTGPYRDRSAVAILRLPHLLALAIRIHTQRPADTEQKSIMTQQEDSTAICALRVLFVSVSLLGEEERCDDLAKTGSGHNHLLK
eukprot:COSAG06_NODE_683_length_13114_cov_7.121322_3_plen_92_part_00